MVRSMLSEIIRGCHLLPTMRMDSVLFNSYAIFFSPDAVLISLTFNPMGLGLSCFSFS